MKKMLMITTIVMVCLFTVFNSCKKDIGQPAILVNALYPDLESFGSSYMNRTTHKQVTSEGTLVEGFETIGDWAVSGTGATIEASTTHKSGTYGLKLNITSGTMGYAYKTIALDLSSATNFIFWVYIDDYTKVSMIIFWFTSSSGGDDRYSVIASSPGTLFNGWNRLVVAKSRFSQSGSGNWASMIRLRVYLVPVSGQSANIIIDDLRKNYTARPKIIMTFDDGAQDTYDNAVPIMTANGQKGSWFIIGNRIDVAGSLTLAEMNTLKGLGWDLCNHTWTHDNLTLLSSANMHSTIDSMGTYLRAHNFPGYKFIAFPTNAWNQTIIDYCKTKNIKLARSGYASDVQPHLNLEGNIPYQIFSISLSNTLTLATFQGYLDNTIAQNGLLVIHGHEIVNSGANDPTEMLTSVFQTISDYIHTKVAAGLIDEETLTEYFNGFL